ncbi:hypothetical protein PFISCL1PPCAC_3668, partial [Pristionchus fissidentatus]
LPDDDLITILSWLDRTTLNIIKRVNRRMNSIVSSETLERVKTKAEYLEILESPFGHAFHLHLNGDVKTLVYRVLSPGKDDKSIEIRLQYSKSFDFSDNF